MARVVRRRKNPLLPVLLAFVFLFLIATTMAVLAYNKGQVDAKAKVAALSARGKIISDSEMAQGRVKQILLEKEKDRKAPTVVGELSRRIDDLTDRVTGSQTTAAAAIAQIESEVGASTFVLNAVKTSRQSAAEASAKATKLQNEINVLKSSIQDSAAAYKTLEDEFKTKADTLAGQVRTVSAEKTALVGTHATAMEASNATWQAQVTKQAQDLNAGLAKASKLQLDIDKLTARNIILRDQLIDRQKKRSLRLAVRAAGKIREVMPDREVCFIPLGTKNRVVSGMTFRVYGPEGIPEDGSNHKASLTVIRTFETLSRCRVTTVKKDDPVAIGDLFANVAFDPSHQPVFVVEGRFDLSGMGRPTDAGTKEVIELIKRSGGKVTDKLTVDVDFVVMGPEPTKPSALGEDEPGPAKKAHEIRMEEYNRWHKTLNRAIALNVPKLNTQRFKTLTGYDSPQANKN